MPTMLDLSRIPRTLWRGCRWWASGGGTTCTATCTRTPGPAAWSATGAISSYTIPSATGHSSSTLGNDRDELLNVSEELAYAEARQRLIELLVDKPYGTDQEWIDGGRLVGTSDSSYAPTPDRGLANQRGYRFR